MKTFWVLISYTTVNDTEIDKRYETFRVARNREREREREREKETGGEPNVYVWLKIFCLLTQLTITFTLLARASPNSSAFSVVVVVVVSAASRTSGISAGTRAGAAFSVVVVVVVSGGKSFMQGSSTVAHLPLTSQTSSPSILRVTVFRQALISSLSKFMQKMLAICFRHSSCWEEQTFGRCNKVTTKNNFIFAVSPKYFFTGD